MKIITRNKKKDKKYININDKQQEQHEHKLGQRYNTFCNYNVKFQNFIVNKI